MSDADDSVQYLRKLGSGLVGTISSHHCPQLNAAADELEQLRDENKELKEEVHTQRRELKSERTGRQWREREIERLKAENQELKEEVAWFANRPDGQAQEIERLKAELAELQNRQLGVVVVPREREEGREVGERETESGQRLP